MPDGLSDLRKHTLNAAMNNANRHNCSVWLSLVATDEKYIPFLLCCVEIRYKGRPVIPTAQLQNLVDLWLGNVTSKKVVAPPLGSSAKEFVLILSYCRRVQPS
ncbi:E3 ubiquitin protein ligase DRIP2 [Linum grandiflorum]